MDYIDITKQIKNQQKNKGKQQLMFAIEDPEELSE